MLAVQAGDQLGHLGPGQAPALAQDLDSLAVRFRARSSSIS
jgi:hypothetical protein